MDNETKQELENIKSRVTKLETDVSTLKTATAVNEEQTKMIFKILNEIKDSIKDIGTKIDEIENRPNRLLYTVAGGVIVAIIIAGIKYL